MFTDFLAKVALKVPNQFFTLFPTNVMLRAIEINRYAK